MTDFFGFEMDAADFDQGHDCSTRSERCSAVPNDTDLAVQQQHRAMDQPGLQQPHGFSFAALQACAIASSGNGPTATVTGRSPRSLSSLTCMRRKPRNRRMIDIHRIGDHRRRGIRLGSGIRGSTVTASAMPRLWLRPRQPEVATPRVASSGVERDRAGNLPDPQVWPQARSSPSRLRPSRKRCRRHY